MVLIATFLVVISAGTFFGWKVPLDHLFDAFQPMIVALSIMVAALLVRLNRGMPTLDWKSLKQEERVAITGAILQLAKEYVFIVSTNSVLVVVLLTLSVTGKLEATKWEASTQQLISAFIGGAITLCAARMGYVIWRDYDIVRLQKKLIDGAGERENQEAQQKLAEAKIAEIRAARR